MSDFILKFWPIDEVKNDKTELIKFQFQKDEIISGETEHWGKPAFSSGSKLGELIGIQNENYISNLKIQIEEKGYGVEQGEEDFEYIDRRNIISIQNGDGEIENWTKFEEYLTNITEDKYKGGWELL